MTSDTNRHDVAVSNVASYLGSAVLQLYVTRLVHLYVV
jgi:hypothetical protein